RQGQRVRRLEDGTQPVTDLVEHDEEVGIEVPEDGSLERLHHLGIRIRRAGPEQQSLRVGHADGRYAIERARPSRMSASDTSSSSKPQWRITATTTIAP